MKTKFYIPKNDLQFVSSSEINIDWVKQCLYSKRNKRNFILTFIVWYTCFLLLIPAVTLAPGVLYDRTWPFNFAEFPEWARYIGAAYVALDTLFISLSLFFMFNQWSINHFSIIKFFILLSSYLNTVDLLKNETFDEYTHAFYLDHESTTSMDIINSKKTLQAKERISFIKDNDLSNKLLNFRLIEFNRKLLLSLSVLELILVIIFLIALPHL